MNIKKSIADLIGNTPLLELNNIVQKNNLPAKLLAKLEYFNPAGSAKDRVALNMLNDAQERGLIGPGAVIIEPTSGNTGIGLAAVAASRGYKVILTMPDTMSKERISLLRAYGAKVILTDGVKGMTGAIEKANEIAAATENSFIPGQFTNPANPAAHYKTTGPEIWLDTDGQIDIFIAGAGTGGTISGVGKYLKEQNPNVKIVAVEPANSPLLTEGRAGAHGLQGIGANFVPDTLDVSVIDEIIPVYEQDAYAAGRELAQTEGILAGITSGAVLHAAKLIARRPENAEKMIVALLPDTGDRYLSTPLFSE